MQTHKQAAGDAAMDTGNALEELPSPCFLILAKVNLVNPIIARCLMTVKASVFDQHCAVLALEDFTKLIKFL